MRSPEGEPVGRYLVISSDCHAGPPAELYRSYMDPEYRDQYDAFLASLAEMRPELSSAEIRFREKFLAKTGDGGLRACWDPDLREKELDNEGVAAEVIFPDADVLGLGGVSASPFGTGLSGSGGDDAELAFAGARAHNRWLADLCACQPSAAGRHHDRAGHPRYRAGRGGDPAGLRLGRARRGDDPEPVGASGFLQ